MRKRPQSFAIAWLLFFWTCAIQLIHPSITVDSCPKNKIKCCTQKTLGSSQRFGKIKNNMNVDLLSRVPTTVEKCITLIFAWNLIYIWGLKVYNKNIPASVDF